MHNVKISWPSGWVHGFLFSTHQKSHATTAAYRRRNQLVLLGARLLFLCPVVCFLPILCPSSLHPHFSITAFGSSFFIYHIYALLSPFSSFSSHALMILEIRGRMHWSSPGGAGPGGYARTPTDFVKPPKSQILLTSSIYCNLQCSTALEKGPLAHQGQVAGMVPLAPKSASALYHKATVTTEFRLN